MKILQNTDKNLMVYLKKSKEILNIPYGLFYNNFFVEDNNILINDSTYSFESNASANEAFEKIIKLLSTEKFKL